jgi:hypothetical protein
VHADEKLTAFLEPEAAIFNAVNKRKTIWIRGSNRSQIRWQSENATEKVRYSCSSGLGGVAPGSSSGLRFVLRCRVDFFPSLGLSVASEGGRSSSLGAVVSLRPPGDGDAPGLPLVSRVPRSDGLAVAAPCSLGEAVACAFVGDVARGLAAAVPCGVGDPLPAGEAVAAGEPVAAGDAVAIGERAAVGEAPGLADAPAAPATPVVVVVVPETPTPALTP